MATDEVPDRDALLDLLEEAGEVLAELHGALPDDGKERGTAPSWWEMGVRSNGIRAAISNALRNSGRGAGSEPNRGDGFDRQKGT